VEKTIKGEKRKKGGGPPEMKPDPKGLGDL
jgi:hypothetical protein